MTTAILRYVYDLLNTISTSSISKYSDTIASEHHENLLIALIMKTIVWTLS